MEHIAPPRAVPLTGPHPEEINPLGKHTKPVMSPDERRAVFIFSLGLVATIILIIMIAAISTSPFINVFLGLSPLLLTMILDIVATSNHYKPQVYWITLVSVHLLALAVLFLINLILITEINVPNAVSVSVLIGSLITLVAMFASNSKPHEEPHHHVPFKPEKIEEYVQSIEDKVKALNFAVGRVYRASNGGSTKMRERLRVPSEWYNEFTDLKDVDMDVRLEKARVLVRKIRDRLSLYAQKEKEVFTIQELATLKHLARNREGEDPVLTVLATNDRDPVENYYKSAIEFCDRILEELEKEKEEI
jgi:hypothetical protein